MKWGAGADFAAFSAFPPPAFVTPPATGRRMHCTAALRPPQKEPHMRRMFRWVIAIVISAIASMAASLPALAADPLPVAIKGYDPVAYYTAGKPTRGRSDLELVWDEHRYQFASEANRAQFKANPARYAPQFSDYCAMALSKGELVEANPENWTIVDGRLYVFGKPVGPDLFRKDVAANAARAEGNRKLLPPR